MTKWLRDVIYGVVIAIVSLFLIRDTYNLQENFIPYETGRAGPYSRFWLWILFALAIVMIIRALLQRRSLQGKAESILNPAPWITVLLLCAYLFTLTRLGFIISTIIYLVIAMTYYSYKSGTFAHGETSAEKRKNIIKHMLIIVVCSLLVTVATYYLFTEAVGVRLPKFSL